MAVPVLKDSGGAVPAAKLRLVNRAVLDACDARDGVTDGLLNDPRTCTFDVAALQCKAGDADDCLTAPQVATMKRAYAPAKTASGEVVFPGKEPGSETAGACSSADSRRRAFRSGRSRSPTTTRTGMRRRSTSIAI